MRKLALILATLALLAVFGGCSDDCDPDKDLDTRIVQYENEGVEEVFVEILAPFGRPSVIYYDTDYIKFKSIFTSDRRQPTIDWDTDAVYDATFYNYGFSFRATCYVGNGGGQFCIVPKDCYDRQDTIIVTFYVLDGYAPDHMWVEW